MQFELQPRTTAGRQFVELTASHATDFATRAAEYDRSGAFPFENITAMQHSGVMAACVPAEFGGLGVTSIHDYAVGMSRLGRGDSSTALLANMHNFRTWFMSRTWHSAQAAGDAAQAVQVGKLLQQIGAGQVIICALASEPGTDLLHPFTEASRSAAGWVLNGRKSFATGAPGAQILGTICRFQTDQGKWRQGLASVPCDTPGVAMQNNWDALGMRASGSHDVVFHNCFIPDAAFMDAGPWGVYTERFLAANSVAAMGLSAAFLGIAEAAYDATLTTLKTRRTVVQGRALSERPMMQHLIAEMAIDMAAARAMLERTTTMADTFFHPSPTGRVGMDDLHAVMQDVQCTKWFVTRKAIDIVDRCLTASGGAGYLNNNLLARLYRDVRAGPFMQPFAPNEAFEYIGKVTLGLDPTLTV